MARNDDGEFELILGNRQLLSVFFLVVVLLTVFFTLGYVVGRSSGPVGQVEVAKSGKNPESGSQSPLVVDPQAKPSPSSTTPVRSAGPPAEAPVAEPPKPAPAAKLEPEPVREPEKHAKAERQPERRPEPPPLVPAPVGVSGDGVGDPAPGSYMQVVSVMKPQADSLVDMLRKQRGLPALIAPGPPGTQLLRVLVGPYKDQAALSKAKSDLETIGFHPFPKKY